MARMQEDASKRECEKVRRVGTADLAMDSGAGMTLCGELASTVEEAKIMAMLGMWCLKEKERGRGTQTTEVT